MRPNTLRIREKSLRGSKGYEMDRRQHWAGSLRQLKQQLSYLRRMGGNGSKGVLRPYRLSVPPQLLRQQRQRFRRLLRIFSGYGQLYKACNGYLRQSQGRKKQRQTDKPFFWRMECVVPFQRKRQGNTQVDGCSASIGRYIQSWGRACGWNAVNNTH